MIQTKRLPLKSGDKYIVIGDIHGRIRLLEGFHRMAMMSGATLVCVGDYVDSLFQTVDNQVRTLQYLADNPDIVCVIGNHDVQYLAPIRSVAWQCSGFSKKKWKAFRRTIGKINFNLYVTIGDDILVTHAGVTNELIDRFGMTSALEVGDYLDSYVSALNDYLSIGRDVQDDLPPLHMDNGILWNRKVTPIPNVLQIYGHTFTDQIKFTQSNGGTLCNVDVLHSAAKGVLITDSNEVSTVSIHGPDSITEEEMYTALPDRYKKMATDKLVQLGITKSW